MMIPTVTAVLEAKYPASYFLARLSRRLIGELIVMAGIRHPSVRQHFQMTSPLEP